MKAFDRQGSLEEVARLQALLRRLERLEGSELYQSLVENAGQHRADGTYQGRNEAMGGVSYFAGGAPGPRARRRRPAA